MNNIENILGTIKGETESWEDVFKRVDKEGGIDLKTLTKIVIYLLEKQDERTTFSRESHGINEGTRGFGQEDTGIQSGDRPTEEEI